MLSISMAVVAQTYTNPRHSSNEKRLKVTKVERTSNSTVLYLKFTPFDVSTELSRISAYPTLTDEATGKKYQATRALNFKWGTKYKGTSTYKVEFPPLPKNTSVVTFREAAEIKNPWVISNIALPIQNNSTTASKPAANKPAANKPAANKPAANKPAANKPAANKPAANKPAANKPAAYDKKKLEAEGYQFSWENPSQSIVNKNFKVTKVIRSNTSTIVHLQYSNHNKLGADTNGSVEMQLMDYDTERRWFPTRRLNFNSGTVSGPFTFKIEYPAIPLSVTTLAIIINYDTVVVENIKVPIRTR